MRSGSAGSPRFLSFFQAPARWRRATLAVLRELATGPASGAEPKTLQNAVGGLKDATSFTIPNWISLALVAVFCLVGYFTYA